MRETVVLREVLESDIDTFYEQQADPESAAMAAFTPRDREALTANWHRIMANEAIVARTIVVDEQVAGHVVSWAADGHHEVGYWVGRQLWGRGVATAALAELLKIVKERPLEAWIAPDNAGSKRVVDKNGFSFVRLDGDYHVFVFADPASGPIRRG